MHRYEVRPGRFVAADGQTSAGYSGFSIHRNKPESERLPGLGPIPCGLYEIGEEHADAVRGPVILPLKPRGHHAHGRSGFLIHGDSKEHPGLASHGCIVLPRHFRELIAESPDRVLLVVADGEPAPAA